MKSFFTPLSSAILFACVGAFMIASCGQGGDSGINRKYASSASIKLSWPEGYRYDPETRSVYRLYAREGAPAYVTKVTLTISGEGMKPLVLDVPLDTLTVDFAIPPGNKTFELLVETNIPGLSFSGLWNIALTSGVEFDISFELEVNSPPTINGVTLSSSTTYKNIPVTLSASVTEFDDDDTLTYSWSGEGDVTGSGQTVTWRSSSSGVFTICVTVSDGKGGSAEDCAQVTVLNRDPVVNSVTADPLSPDMCEQISVPISLYCSASDPDGDDVRYGWTGPGGFSASGSSATYDLETTSPVTLTCHADDGDGGVGSKSVTVMPMCSCCELILFGK